MREEEERAADEAAQERAGVIAGHRVGIQSPGYVRATHPEHGEPVTFQPGELLPDWAAQALAKERPEPDEHNVYRLATPTRPQAKRKGGGS